MEDFVKKFNEKRVVAHTRYAKHCTFVEKVFKKIVPNFRKIKAEKLGELLRQQYQYQPTAGSRVTGGFRDHSSAPYPTTGGAASLAYPAFNQAYANSTNYRHSYMS